MRPMVIRWMVTLESKRGLILQSIEQDHRGIKRRVNASLGFRSFDGAWRTIQGYAVVHMIRKGQVRWLPKGDVLGLIVFLNEILRTERGMKSLRDAYLRGI